MGIKTFSYSESASLWHSYYIHSTLLFALILTVLPQNPVIGRKKKSGKLSGELAVHLNQLKSYSTGTNPLTLKSNCYHFPPFTLAFFFFITKIGFKSNIQNNPLTLSMGTKLLGHYITNPVTLIALLIADQCTVY